MAVHTSTLFFSFFFLLLTVATGQESGGACTTSEGRDGKCVKLKNCPPILNLLLNIPSELRQSRVERAREHHCGNFDGAPHVCCELPITRPSEEVSTESIAAGTSVLMATPCGTSDANRVANGVDALLSEFPWMALLMYDNKLEASFDCGGSLITDRYVLTAAHCIVASPKRLVSVRLGEHDLTKTIDCRDTGTKCAPPVQDIAVEEAIHHKDYNRNKLHYDIGLIRLAEKATIHSSVRPICLPVTPASKATQPRALVIAGWGKMETGQKATVLQKALVSPITNDKCQETFKSLEIMDNQMCAGGENEVDSCKGDSGGPAFYTSRYGRGARIVQYGIVSAGVIQCGSNYPGIYVRTLPFVDWIAGHLKP